MMGGKMISSNEASALAKAVQLIEAALNKKFDKWKEKAIKENVSKEIIDGMEDTHDLVINYIYGSLGHDIVKTLTQTIRKEERHGSRQA